MDSDTLEGIQFGVGALNVALAILPAKIAKMVSILGVRGDKRVGYALLEMAARGGGVRAPIAQLLCVTCRFLCQHLFGSRLTVG